MNYRIHPAKVTPGPAPDWRDPAWKQAEIAELNYFRPESSSHHPRTRARLLYDAQGLHGLFHVRDRYVRCVRTNYFDEVWKDSCVEFFVEPRPGAGYFNLEFNCGGAFLCNHILDPERTPDGFARSTKLSPEIGLTIQVRSSLPPRVEPEIAKPVVWAFRFFVPFSLFEHYVGPLGRLSGQVWRGNFYKCADESSHPHWGCWSPVGQLNFHLPGYFGALEFA